MGNEQSLSNDDELPISPVIQKLKKTIRLTIITKKTSSFINDTFCNQIKKNSGQISRINSPFCPIIFQNSQINHQQPITSCLISPVMAIASSRFLLDDKLNYSKKAKLLALTKKHGQIQIKVKDLIIIEKTSICLLLLQKSIIDLGWAGISYISNPKDIQNQAFKIINFSTQKIDQIKSNYRQQITKAFYKVQNQLKGIYKTIPGSLIFKIMDRKPYIVGIQTDEKGAEFISKDLLQKISEKGNRLIDLKTQRQIISSIDIQQLQLMQKL